MRPRGPGYSGYTKFGNPHEASLMALTNPGVTAVTPRFARRAHWNPGPLGAMRDSVGLVGVHVLNALAHERQVQP